MSRCILLVDGERIWADAIVGNGADSFVIRRGDHVLKIPTLHGTLLPDGTVEPDSENEMYIERLDPEKRIYKRLHGVPGIAKCIECTSNGILLKYYRKGDLERYIAANEPAPMSWRWRWIIQATDIISNCHENGVLDFDIALLDGGSMFGAMRGSMTNVWTESFREKEMVPTSNDITYRATKGKVLLRLNLL